MRPPEKMIIYNLFPLLAGKFSRWPSHLRRAKQLGFNWVFVNPIQKTGRSGSLYSLADHRGFNPLLVDQKSTRSPEEQAKDMAEQAADLGLKLMVDLVINHCAVDSPLVSSHPEWFLWDRPGRIAHPFCNEDGKKVVWRDLAKFDHKHSKDREGLFRFFLDVILFLVGLGFQGFRCDAAYQVPRSLWKRLIEETKSRHPHVAFFAETLGCPPDQTIETARAGFDYIFNSAKWWDFHSQWLMMQYALTREIAPSVGFPESHDTARLFEELGGNLDGMRQRYLFTALFSTGVLMPIGFEYGFSKKLHVVKTRPEDWETTGVDLCPFIKKVNALKGEHPIFQEEAPTEILPQGSPHVMVMWKGSISTREEALVIVNKDLYNRQTFYADNLLDFVQAGAPLVDVSPERPMDYIPVPFHYDLRPGQGLVLVTSRDAVNGD